MKCANCDNEALYTYQTPSVGPIHYCVKCLPAFLRPAAKAGALDRAPAFAEQAAVVAEVLSPDAEVKPSKRRSKREQAQPAPVPTKVVDAAPEDQQADIEE